MNDIFDKFPEISLKQAVLREIKIGDATAFYGYVINENITKYISDNEIPSSAISAQDELRYWINLFKYKNSIYWTIADKKATK